MTSHKKGVIVSFGTVDRRRLTGGPNHVHDRKGIEKMLYYNNVCKQQRKEKKNIQSSKAKSFVMPVSEKKDWTVIGVLRRDV